MTVLIAYDGSASAEAAVRAAAEFLPGGEAVVFTVSRAPVRLERALLAVHMAAPSAIEAMDRGVAELGREMQDEAMAAAR